MLIYLSVHLYCAIRLPKHLSIHTLHISPCLPLYPLPSTLNNIWPTLCWTGNNKALQCSQTKRRSQIPRLYTHVTIRAENIESPSWYGRELTLIVTRRCKVMSPFVSRAGQKKKRCTPWATLLLARARCWIKKKKPKPKKNMRTKEGGMDDVGNARHLINLRRRRHLHRVVAGICYFFFLFFVSPLSSGMESPRAAPSLLAWPVQALANAALLL